MAATRPFNWSITPTKPIRGDERVGEGGGRGWGERVGEGGVRGWERVG